MSQSLKFLINKSKYKNLNNEISFLLANSINTGLTGFKGENILFSKTSDIDLYLDYINQNIDKITKLDVKEVFLLDSYHSATIEGARTSVEDVKKAFINENKTKSELMVINNVKALNYALKEGISENNIRNIWNILVENCCENETKKGIKYRDGDVFVASIKKVIHTPCPYDKIEFYMNELFNYSLRNKLLEICIKHFYFVYIHPFCDGNGRFARLWSYRDLIENVNNNFKYISISKQINENLNNYYISLEESEFLIDNKMYITTFIEYYLECICNAINKGLNNSLILSEVEKYLVSKINKDGITVKKLVNTKYSESTIRNSLNNLVSTGILYKIKEGNHYKYFKREV